LGLGCTLARQGKSLFFRASRGDADRPKAVLFLAGSVDHVGRNSPRSRAVQPFIAPVVERIPVNHGATPPL